MLYPSKLLLAAIVACLSIPARGLAQSAVNPDISVVPQFLVESSDDARLAEGRHTWSRPNFTFKELELALQSYLNPYARADVFLSLPGPDLEKAKLGLEEAYATVLRGLPFDLNLRFGKYRVEYGKINMIHPHAWPFVTQPISQERFLGEEGLNDLGLSASVLLPTGDVYTRLTVDLLRGGAIGEAAGIDDTAGIGGFYANSVRLMGFFPLGDESDIELGVSGLTGIHDPYHRDRFWYANLDFKYKYRPSAYTSLTVQGEYLLNVRKAEQDRTFAQFVNANGDPERRSVVTSGWYVFADCQFLKIYSVGGRFDWSQSPYSENDKARGVGVFLGYYPVEETIGVQLQYQNTTTEFPGASESVNAVRLRVSFSMGPHKVHPF